MMPKVSIAAAMSVAAVTIAGCGESVANDPRPPAPIVVSASVSDHKVSVSPADFGAGTVNLIVTNQTSASQRVTLRSLTLAGSAKRLEQTTGPINPDDTALLKADLGEGTYTLSVGAAAIDAAKIAVGHPRPSASNTLLEP